MVNTMEAGVEIMDTNYTLDDTSDEIEGASVADAVRASVQAYRMSLDSMMMKARLATSILDGDSRVYLN